MVIPPLPEYDFFDHFLIASMRFLVQIIRNPQFLTEALRVVDSDEISLELTAPNRPG